MISFREESSTGANLSSRSNIVAVGSFSQSASEFTSSTIEGPGSKGNDMLKMTRKDKRERFKQKHFGSDGTTSDPQSEKGIESPGSSSNSTVGKDGGYRGGAEGNVKNIKDVEKGGSQSERKNKDGEGGGGSKDGGGGGRGGGGGSGSRGKRGSKNSSTSGASDQQPLNEGTSNPNPNTIPNPNHTAKDEGRHRNRGGGGGKGGDKGQGQGQDETSILKPIHMKIMKRADANAPSPIKHNEN